MLMKLAFAGFTMILMATLETNIGASDGPINDAVILSQVLQTKYKDGGFTVVARMTSLPYLPLSDEAEAKFHLMQSMREKFKAAGYEVDQLLQRLIDKNKNKISLDLTSSPADGYIVDIDGKFEKLRRRDGGGWKKWYEENPKAHGFTEVSLPVYDEKTQYILIYKGTRTNLLAGGGYLILYKYSEGKLEELARVELWAA